MPYKDREKQRAYLREYQRRLRELGRMRYGKQLGPICDAEADAHLENLSELRKHPSLILMEKKKEMSKQERMLSDPYFATLCYVFDTAKKFFNWTNDEMDEAYKHMVHTWFTETEGFNELDEKEQMLLVAMNMAKTLSALMEPSRHIPNRTLEKLVF